MTMHLDVESTGVTDRSSISISPPQTGLSSLTVAANCIWSNQQLPVVRLEIVRNCNNYHYKKNVKSLPI